MNDAPMKGLKRRFTFSLLASVWLIYLILGLALKTGESAPRDSTTIKILAPLYLGDLQYYVLAPAFFLALNILLIKLGKRTPRLMSIAIASAQLYSLATIVFLNTGGA